MKSSYVYPAMITSMIIAFLSPTVVFAKPSVGTLTPNSNLTAGVSTLLSATVTSGTSIQICSLYVDSENIGSMVVSGSNASYSYTFPAARVYTAFVFCKDTNGGMTAGANTSMNVTQGATQAPVAPLSGVGQQEPEPELISEVQEQIAEVSSEKLVTLACPEGAEVDHACKAVYYVDTNGARHAFPNSKVYFTWYENFDSVETVTQEELATYQLGLNVTYRPGVRMVKFQSLNDVYAVTLGGTLRKIASEEVAQNLYGVDWNKKIDDISDTFFTNYKFGNEIKSETEYEVETEMSEAASVSASF